MENNSDEVGNGDHEEVKEDQVDSVQEENDEEMDSEEAEGNEIDLDLKEAEGNGAEKANNPTPDPCGYVENAAFTSEKYKIEIRGLPKYFSIKDLRKFLNVKLNLNCNKVKSTGKICGKLAYACFRSEEERDKGLEILKKSTWKNHKLTAKLSKPVADPYLKKKLEQNVNRDEFDTVEQQKEALLKSVTPLYSLPYPEQLIIKEKNARKALNQLGAALTKNNILKKWLGDQKSSNESLPCKLHPIRYLNNFTEKYRNKCEFSVAYNVLTGERTVGFRLGSYASGSVSVVSVEDVKIIPDAMKEATKAFETFVQKSKYEPYSPKSVNGHWKMLTARVGTQTNELMLMIGFDPQQLPEEQIRAVKDELREFFTTKEGSGLKLDSLYFRLMPRNEKGHPGYSPELLYGKTHIEEVLCGLKFKISPESFFQVNSRCAELLVQSVKELAGIDKETIVVDVCCGTGTLGLCLANECKQVFGIEVVEQAVKDARDNAEANNIKNSTFFCGKADEILACVIKKAEENAKVVAIVDPPRAGLHKYAIQKLRNAKNLQRFVYLACDVKSALNNFTELGRECSKTLVGDPFVPVAAIPVDMFPLTNHYELIIIFERLNSSLP